MGHSWCSSGTESEAEQVEMRGSRHRRPCQLRIYPIVPAERVGGPYLTADAWSIHVSMSMREAKSGKRKAPWPPPTRRGWRQATASQRDGRVVVGVEGCRNWWLMSPPSTNVTVEDCGRGQRCGLRGMARIELTPPSLLGDGGCAAQHAETKSEETELNLEMRNGENSVSQGPVCFSRCPVQTQKGHRAVTCAQATVAHCRLCLSQRRKACVLWWARAGAG